MLTKGFVTPLRRINSEKATLNRIKQFHFFKHKIDNFFMGSYQDKLIRMVRKVHWLADAPTKNV